MATQAEIQTAYKALYRADLNAAVAKAIADTGISVDAYVARELPNVSSTTQAAVAIASFVTGLAPTSAKLDELKIEADKQVASYTSLGVANPALGAYEAFGRSFATDTTTTAGFNTKYGALSTTDFVNLVYAQVYGTTPSAGALANLTAQVTSFTALYTANNVPNAALAAKGAVLGQIVGYAFTSPASANSTLDNQVANLLTSAAKGDTSVYNKALAAVVDPGQTGVSISFVATDTVSPTQANPALKSTAFNDTLTGVVDSTTKVDAGGGEDTGNFSYAGAATPAAGNITGVETIVLTNTAGGTAFALTNVTGYKTVGFKAGTDGQSATNIAAGTALTLEGAAANTTFAIKDADTNTADVVNLQVNGFNTVAKTVRIDNVETLNVTAVTADSAFTLIDTALKTLSVTANKNITIDLAAANVSALETITASGSGFVDLNDTAVSTTIKTVDASGLTGATGVFFTGANAGNVTSVKGGAGVDSIVLNQSVVVSVDGGAGNDVINVTNAGANTFTVKGGAGADNITLTNGKITVVYTAQSESTNASFDTITGFSTTSDKFNFAGLGLTGGKTAITTFTTAGAIADAAGLFSGNAVAYGQFGGAGSYYVIADTNNNGNFDLNADLIIATAGIGAGAVVFGDFIFS